LQVAVLLPTHPAMKAHIWRLDKLLEKDVAKQRLSKDEATEARGRLTSTTNYDNLSDVDFVIEAVPVCYIEAALHCFTADMREGNTRAQI
jgi:3-hydroxyacyl-CoA dehydrogenase